MQQRQGIRIIGARGRSLWPLFGAVVWACSDAGGGDTPPPSPVGSAGTASQSANGGAGSVGGVGAPGGSGGEPNNPNTLLGTPVGFVNDPPAEEPPPPPMLFPESPSCVYGEPDECEGASCCAREGVPTGEIMLVAPNTGVSLSSYGLDKFEVTVARFRAFLGEYNAWRDSGNPAAGSGAHPFTPGSGWDQDPTWEGALAGSAAVLRVGLACNPTQQTWTDEPGVNDLRPINCVSWFEAFAFCVWDEGRLPTEAEWQYAAVGGGQGRQFAWGNTGLMPSFAVYGCLFAGTGATCSVDDIPPVGSKPDGRGRFGHSDLAGSVYEWTLDWFAPYPEALRDNYAKTDAGQGRVLRGGGWDSTSTQALLSTGRLNHPAPTFRSINSGIRCARDVEDMLR